MIASHTRCQRVLFILTTSTIYALFILTYSAIGFAQPLSDADMGSVGLVSSVSGKARVVRAANPQTTDQASINGSVVYGDRIQTGAQSMLGMLIGDNVLVTIQEFSEVMVTKEAGHPQVVNLLNGRTCVASQPQANPADTPLVIHTPTTTVIAEPGTLLQIQVPPASDQTNSTNREHNARPVLTSFPVSPRTSNFLRAQVGDSADPSSVTGQETIQVLEGSVEVISQVPGLEPVTVEAGQMVRVINGTMNRPTTAPPVSCRTQDLQKEPNHLITPPATQTMIAQQEMKQATALVKQLQATAAPEGGTEESMVKGPEASKGKQGNPENPSFITSSPIISTSDPEFTPDPCPPFPCQLPLSLPFPNSTVATIEGDLLNIDDPVNNLNLMGDTALTVANNSTLTITGNGFVLTNGSNLDGGSLLTVTNSPNTVNIGKHLVDLDSSTITLTNTAVTVDASTVNIGLDAFRLRNSSTFTVTNGGLVSLTDSTLTTGGDLLNLSQSTLTATDALIRIENASTFTVTNGGLVSLTGNTLTTGGDLLNLSQSTLTVTDSLLTATNGTQITLTSYVASLANGSTLNIGTNPLVNLTNSTLTAAGILRLNNQTFTMNQALTSLQGTSTLTATDALVRVENGSTFTVTGTFTDFLVTVGSQLPNLTLNGSLLAIDASQATITSDLVTLSSNTMLKGGNVPLISISNASPGVTIGGRLASISDSTVVIDDVFVQANNGRIDITGNGLVLSNNGQIVDSGLMEATRPLVNLVNNSTMSVGGDFFQADASSFSGNLGNMPGDALVMLNASDMTVNGNFITLANASTFTLSGVFANLANGSLFDVSGGLVAFQGIGNTFTIDNNLCLGGGCTTFGQNVTIFFTNGATPVNNIINILPTYDPFPGNPGSPGNTINFDPAQEALLVLDGAGNTVNLGGP